MRDQNNVRQGVAPPSQPAQPASRHPPPATSPTPVQQSLARLRADLTAIKANSPVTAEQKQQITKDLMAVRTGHQQAFPGDGRQFGQQPVGGICRRSPLADKDCSRLLSDLAAVLNPAKIQPTQMQAIHADIQAIFQANGMARKDAVKIVDQVKAVGAETQVARLRAGGKRPLRAEFEIRKSGLAGRSCPLKGVDSRRPWIVCEVPAKQ